MLGKHSQQSVHFSQATEFKYWYSTNNDVKMFVTVWEPAIRNQCATTEAMALIVN